jgi:hypothetical protein
VSGAKRFFAVFIVALAAAFAAAPEATAQHVTVDTSILTAKGVPAHYAAVIRAELAPRVRNKLAGKYTGPVTIRIKTLQLASFPMFRSSQPTDYLEGDVIIPGRAPIPILLPLPFDPAPASFTPSGEARRIYFLIEYFSSWVARYV